MPLDLPDVDDSAEVIEASSDELTLLGMVDGRCVARLVANCCNASSIWENLLWKSL